jgi:DNA-binding SARP family transcriptional activator/pimeloyl-ACP methyl ester carboxylesterase
MTEVKLFLFGAPRIERDGKSIQLNLKKAMAMIAYLAVTERPQSRDFLAGLLWPESDQTTARSNLRRTLYLIQQKVGEGFLRVSNENLEISPEAHFWLDLKDFQKQIADCLPESASDHLIQPQCKTKLEAADALYVDDFMAGFSISDSAAFEEWQFFAREDLRQKLASALKQLIKYYLSDNDPNRAIPHARRWLAMDRLHEPAHQMLMELYARTGQQAAALHQYQECSRLLNESLGVNPEPKTVELYEAIKAGKISILPSVTFTPPEVHYVQSGDVHIAYQVLGSGPVDFLIIPGFVSHLEVIWESPSLAQALLHFASFSRLILFDKRGMGLSDRVGYPPTLEHTMDDILAVMDAIGSKRVVLFGFAEGGPNSLVFCAAHPDRVLGLILYGTSAKGSRSSDYPLALTEEQYAKWLDWLWEVWGKPVPHLYFAPSREGERNLWEWFARVLRLGSSPGVIRAALEVIKDFDVRDILPTIRTPTLIIHRLEDQAWRIAAGRYLAEHIPGARYVELPGDDDWWWLGDTDSIIKEIEGFISKLKHAPSPDRFLATILCIRWEQKKNASPELRGQVESLISQQVKKQRGRWIKNDSQIYLSTFDGPSRAIQSALRLNQIARQRGIPLRIVLHSGECFFKEEELHGEAVEIAKSALQFATEDFVLASRTVKDLVVGAGFSFESRSKALLKSKLGIWQFYQVR